MTRFKQHLWFLGFLFAFKALAANAHIPTSNPPTVGTVELHISSALANVGDLIPIDFKVGSFTNIEQLIGLQVNWNSSYLQFDHLEDTDLSPGSTTNFDITTAATGKVVLNWKFAPAKTLLDSTVLFRIFFKVKSYTGTPVPIFIPFAVATQPIIGQTPFESFTGYVYINKDNSCNGRAPGLNCTSAPLLCPGDFPFCNTLPNSNKPFANGSGGCSGSLENSHLFYFDAGSPSIRFKITAKNCNGGPGGNGIGLQYFIFDGSNCPPTQNVFCGGASGSVIDPGASVFVDLNLVVGKRYLFMLDGQLNDICDYLIEIVSGSVGGAPVILPSEILGSNTTCPNQKGLDYSIKPRIDALNYEWKIEGGGTIVSGQSTNAIKVNWGATAGRVCVKVVGNCGTSDFACKDVSLGSTTPNNRTETVCPGGSAKIGTEIFTATNFYTRTLKSILGCDSVVNLNLTVLAPIQLTKNENKTICPGDSVKIGSQVFKTPNTYTVTLSNASYTGCDSIVKLTLSYYDSIPRTFALNKTICQGSGFPLGGKTYTTTGSYRVVLPKASFTGCDSIINLSLTVFDSLSRKKTIDKTVCPGGAFSVGGTNFTASGNYRVVLPNASVTGCDSIVNLNLTVLPAASLTQTLNRTICGGSITIGSSTFNASGTYTVPLSKASYLGCDSTVILNLSVINGSSATKIIDKTICQGDSVIVNGKAYKTSTTIILPNASYTGCDSTVALNITVVDIAVSITKSNDITCAFKNATLTGIAIVSPNTAVITHEWRDAANTLVSMTPSVLVTQGGVYTLKVKATINGLTCEKTTTATVNKSGGLPVRPEMLGDVATCENKVVTYNIVNPPATGVTKYNWMIQGGTITAGAGTAVVSVTWGLTGKGKICVNAENGCGISDSTCLDVKINNIPLGSSILGDTKPCPRSTSTFYTNDTLNVTNFQWTVPQGAAILRGQGTKHIDVSWSTNTGGQVCLVPSNNCGTAPQKCLNVVIDLTPPDSIPLIGKRGFCPGDIDTLKAKVDSTIAKVTWRTSSNVTFLSSINSPNVVVRYDNGTDALIILDIENKCGNKRSEIFYATIKSQPPAPLPFTGKLVSCSNDTMVYSVSGNPSIASYEWSLPDGGTILSGKSTQSIKVAWVENVPLARVCIKTTLAGCAVTVDDCYEVKVKQAPMDTFSILGVANPCPASTAKYTVTPNPRFRIYNWIVPASGTIVKGQGSGEIDIKWANSITTGTLCVDISNDCGTTRRECFKINIKPNIDSLSLKGISQTCEGGTATFIAQKDTVAISYTWSVPTGSTIVSGQGKDTLKVLFGSMSGFVKIQTNGGCAARPSSINVLVKNAPDAPASIAGANSVCQGETVSYKAASVLNIKSYKWQVPTGAVLVGSDSADVVTVRWAAATSGKLMVKTKSECFESLDKTLDVTVSRLPSPKAGVDDSICDKLYNLKGVLSLGTPVWRVIQKPIGSSLTFADSTKANSEITASKQGIYLLTLTEKNNVCVASDTVSLFIKDSPVLTLVNDNCNATSTQYNVNVAIKGNAPFTVFGTTMGSIAGTNFTSTALAESSKYSVTVKDVYGCASNTLVGIKECPCVTQSAVLRNAPIVVCLGLKSKIDIETKANFDADDTFEYILHDGTPTTTGTILQTNKTGEFDFIAAKMQYNRTYYVQYRVGNNNNGSVITTDRCFKASSSIPIIFKGKITVALVGDTAICANTSANLTFKTNSTDAFDISLRNDKENTTVNLYGVKNNNTASISPSLSTTYRLLQGVDKNGCPTEILDSAKVSIRSKLFPNAGIDQTVCVKTATLSATLPPQYVANWRTISGAAIANTANPNTSVSNLQSGKNIFILTASDSVCTSYRTFDTVAVFLPTNPKALDLALEMFMGDTIHSELTENAPIGTYTVTRLTNPATGRFDVFSNGAFNYISNPNYKGVAKFKFMVCSESCVGYCDTGEVRILIKPKPVKLEEIVIDVPNAITPNDDGKNDVLVIDNIEKFPEAELTIFNRWGDVLFLGRNYKNSWGGTNQNGQPLPEGTYYYVLRLNLNNGKILRGDMTILR